MRQTKQISEEIKNTRLDRLDAAVVRIIATIDRINSKLDRLVEEGCLFECDPIDELGEPSMPGASGLGGGQIAAVDVVLVGIPGNQLATANAPIRAGEVAGGRRGRRLELMIDDAAAEVFGRKSASRDAMHRSFGVKPVPSRAQDHS